MDNWSHLMKVLETSIERNGIQPLTNQWLLNIMRLAEREKALQTQWLEQATIEERYGDQP